MANKSDYTRAHIEGLRATRRQMREEEVRLRRDGARLDRVIRELEAMSPRNGSSGAPHVDGHARLRTVAEADLSSLTQRDAAKIVLARASRDLTVREILHEFERGGRQLKSKNAYRSLYRQLREDSRFASTRGKWRLVSDAAPRGEQQAMGDSAAAV